MNKNNVIIICFLLLMLASGYYAWKLYAELKAQKIKLAKSESELRVKSDENEKLTAQLDSMIKGISYYTKTENSKFQNDTTLNKLIRTARSYSDSRKVTNLSSYQQAYQLDRDGFAALVKNDFEKALVKFTAAEKTSPSFHMSYEISRLLRNNRKDFSNPRQQQLIKKQIIEKFSWKAPPDLLKILKSQVPENLPATHQIMY